MPHELPSLLLILLTGLLAREAAASTPPATATTAPARTDLRIITFNIRYPAPRDILNGNGWPMRKELLFKTIEAFDPDLMGLQEVVPAQGEEIKARFTAYDFLGVPRNDGKSVGEMAAVLFRRTRFEKLRDGHFWLSQTPDVIGSKGWDADLPRIVTWVELRDLANDRRPLLLVNTHFDHIGREARLESAKLLRRRMIELAGDREAVIVTGDFNARPDSPPYQEMLGPSDSSLRLIDSFREAHPQPTSRQFSVHGFTGENSAPVRIDWVLRSRHFLTLSAEIDRNSENGRYPSDHFPVEAILRWNAPATSAP
jgi:endonuclease/exonuclease/phosphatase family metal-dependent hydrolase